MVFKNKKAVDDLAGVVVFIILNAMFFVLLFWHVTNIGKGDDMAERIYAKKICLAIDQLRPNSELKIYIQELFDHAEENRYAGEVVSVLDYERGEIRVRVSEGGGYDFKCFNHFDILIRDNVEMTLLIKT